MFDFKGKQIYIHLGPLIVILRKPDLVMLAVEDGHPDLVGDALGWAQHLTVVMPADEAHAQSEHNLRPHLTKRKRGRRPHRFLGTVTVQSLERFADKFQKLMSERWLKHTRPVALDDLVAAGYGVVVFRDEEMEKFVDSHIKGNRGHFGVRKIEQVAGPMLKLTLDSIECPDTLRGREDQRAPTGVVRFDTEEEIVGIGTVMYFPHGLPPDWHPGWYLTEQDWLDADGIRDLLAAAGGPGLIRALDQIADALLGGTQASSRRAAGEG